MNLGPGTYYLVLQNAVTASGNPIYWDENNGPSTASDSGIGDLNGFDRPGTNSEAFQILGTTGVPEPATWATTILGFGLLGSALRRRKAAAVAA